MTLHAEQLVPQEVYGPSHVILQKTGYWQKEIKQCIATIPAILRPNLKAARRGTLFRLLNYPTRNSKRS
jgi:hypothetical protein